MNDAIKTNSCVIITSLTEPTFAVKLIVYPKSIMLTQNHFNLSQLTFMITENDCNVIKITMTIQETCPELSKLKGEMTIIIPANGSPEITINDQINYNIALTRLLKNYHNDYACEGK